jgi:hypothetical protein
MAGLAGVVAVNGHGPGGVGGVLAVGPSGKTVVAEVVTGAIRGGQPPVLAVFVTVVTVRGRQALDLGAVILLQPELAIADGDEFAALAVEGEEGVVVRPAQVAGLVAVGVLDSVVGARLVASLDEAR